jgi:signal transduction histidine kinase/DNA-binding response OmpR family regulator
MLMVAASLRSFLQGFRAAIFMALAFVPYLLGTIMRALALFGVAHGIFLENIFHQSAAAIALILIAISLEDRLVYVRDRQSAESEAIRQKNQQLIDNEKLMARDQEATIRVAQMLAHDIRRPFSILRMGINFISRARDYAEVQESLAKLIPEIDAASGNADALILDILEMGSVDKHSIKDIIYPEALITDAIKQAFIVYPQSSITIDYDLRHSTMLFANRAKMMRVFTNIYMNAVQAMHYHGHTWFKSRDVIVNGEPFVEFCIGNAGSYISDENITKIFDAYFTSGKANGTGLGLAVARKVITGKGGQIRCESAKSHEYPDGKVEFFFTVPVAKGHPARSQKILFSTSADVRNAMESGVIVEHTSDRSGDDTIGFLEAELVKRSQLMGRTLRVLVIDDDKFYADRLAALGKNSVGFTKSVSITMVLNAQDALEIVKGQTFDLIITDVDLGVFSLSGFDLVKQMRGRHVESVVCVHSNRIAASDHKIAAIVGADLYLPKPMGTAQLFRLILQSSDKLLPSSASLLPSSPNLVATLIKADTSYVWPRESDVVIIIDDSPFVLEAWSAALKGQAKVHLLSSSQELAQRISAQPDFLNHVRCIVTDYYLGEGSLNGLEIARMIKTRRPDIPVFLSSDAILADSEWRGIVDRVISKDPLPFDKLCA